MLLMRKFVTMQYEEQPLQIKSVTAPEGLKGKTKLLEVWSKLGFCKGLTLSNYGWSMLN